MKQYTFEDFVAIIEQLRAPGGCPWDQKQTHTSLRSCMKEETAELLASIRIYDQTGNAENMREELGDILLQVVMHSVIAKEEGIFTLEDVIDEVTRKMIHRHPHVFGEENFENVGEQLNRWDELKKEEKAGKEWAALPLHEIPVELGTLTRAEKISRKCMNEYSEVLSYEDELNKLSRLVEELKEINPEKDPDTVSNVLGQALLAESRIAGRYRLGLESKLDDLIDEIIQKYEPES